MKHILFIGCALMITMASGQARAEVHSHPSPSADDAQFRLDPGMVDKIFHETETASHRGNQTAANAVSFGVQASYLNFGELRLENAYFKNDFAETLGTAPLVQVGAMLPGFVVGPFVMRGELSAAFGVREALVNVSTLAGVAFRDIIRLHWLPITAALRIEFTPGGAEWITGYLRLGAGVEWIAQSGRLDGMSQNYWIPFATVGAGVRLFDARRDKNGWFGGLVLGASAGQSVASSQTFRFWSADAGVEVLL